MTTLYAWKRFAADGGDVISPTRLTARAAGMWLRCHPYIEQATLFVIDQDGCRDPSAGELTDATMARFPRVRA